MNETMAFMMAMGLTNPMFATMGMPPEMAGVGPGAGPGRSGRKKHGGRR